MSGDARKEAKSPVKLFTSAEMGQVGTRPAEKNLAETNPAEKGLAVQTSLKKISNDLRANHWMQALPQYLQPFAAVRPVRFVVALLARV
jgi:hypothetical protein